VSGSPSSVMITIWACDNRFRAGRGGGTGAGEEQADPADRAGLEVDADNDAVEPPVGDVISGLGGGTGAARDGVSTTDWGRPGL
jgi:hypothetical protein